MEMKISMDEYQIPNSGNSGYLWVYFLFSFSHSFFLLFFALLFLFACVYVLRLPGLFLYL